MAARWPFCAGWWHHIDRITKIGIMASIGATVSTIIAPDRPIIGPDPRPWAPDGRLDHDRQHRGIDPPRPAGFGAGDKRRKSW
jgi:hypothetical protein